MSVGLTMDGADVGIRSLNNDECFMRMKGKR